MPGRGAARAVPGGRIEPERPVHAGEKGFLPGVCRPVRPRDDEECREHLLERAAIVAEGLGKLLGELLISGCAFPRLVEEAADLVDRFGRDAEVALEGLDLGAIHRAVALGELGREHDDRDREDFLAPAEQGGDARRAERRARAAKGAAELASHLAAQIAERAGIRRVAERGADDEAERPSHGQARHPADDLAPISHAALVAELFSVACGG